jgi:hypothetical protein
LVLCLLIVSSSVYFGNQWRAEAQRLKGGFAKAEKEKVEVQAALKALTATLTPDAQTLTLEAAVPAVMLDVFNRRVEHGVSISSASPAKSGGGSMAQLLGLAEDVPGSKLKSVKVNLAGSYKDYAGLLGYLKALQTGQAAVTRLKVQDKAFEISLRIYGPADKS